MKNRNKMEHYIANRKEISVEIDRILKGLGFVLIVVGEKETGGVSSTMTSSLERDFAIEILKDMAELIKEREPDRVVTKRRLE